MYVIRLVGSYSCYECNYGWIEQKCNKIDGLEEYMSRVIKDKKIDYIIT
jgi:hypothetical protein